MRIIAGTYRGRKLISPEGGRTRPTLDRVKENLFNLLGRDFSGARVLDLFCGSGGLGLEAVSRGAAETIFCDNDPRAVGCLKANGEGMTGTYQILECGYQTALARVEGPFDLIFLDPPYRENLYDDALRLIAERKLLAPGGIAAAECDRPLEPPEGFRVRKQRRYGRVWLTLLAAEPEQTEGELRA